ncbi:polysaccharide deacetylase family protein [Leptolyngbya sp. 15MV]|nr:polysaccharide deacetylase family protein [Leptolyngbya sp. 15MV]
MSRSLLDPPPPAARARFAPGFGQRALLTVDTEEEFDWTGQFSATGHSLAHVPRLRVFQEFCEGLGVIPVYLVDWPIASSPEAVEIIGGAVRAGTAEIGIQLHPWVSPPHDEELNPRNSYAGNLPHELERAKLLRLRDLIEQGFGTPPLIYRAGRYGLGPRTHEILREAGVAIDTSVRANFDYRAGHGPDYSAHPLEPWWADDERLLLELPVTTVFWGMLRRQGRWLHPLAQRVPRLQGLLPRAGLLERIPLTPEGVTLEEATRGIDIAIDDGLPVLVLSFHSPSLAFGHTPYVRSEADLDRLYGWLSGVYAYLDRRGVRPTSVAGVMAAVERE